MTLKTYTKGLPPSINSRYLPNSEEPIKISLEEEKI